MAALLVRADHGRLSDFSTIRTENEGRLLLAIAPFHFVAKFCCCFLYEVALAAAACSRIFAALPASATPRSSIVAFVLGSTPQYP
jgi:hypothetical protein